MPLRSTRRTVSPYAPPLNTWCPGGAGAGRGGGGGGVCVPLRKQRGRRGWRVRFQAQSASGRAARKRRPGRRRRLGCGRRGSQRLYIAGS